MTLLPENQESQHGERQLDHALAVDDSRHRQGGGNRRADEACTLSAYLRMRDDVARDSPRNDAASEIALPVRNSPSFIHSISLTALIPFEPCIPPRSFGL